ncbi:hypothetical protein [Chryseobacterium sp.]|uniref:hypothetical protein n=1 Tax=Chryseobacterium sp. TaxID=1871047 RepID=UPI002897F90B|nr:hypothetical protein [Chryseobacterium sp.]
MKKRVFKYRAVGITLFIVQVLILLLFAEGSYISYEEFSISEGFSLQNFVLVFSVAIFITALISLFSLGFRGKKSILLLNINYAILFSFFVYGYLKNVIQESEAPEDIVSFSIIFLVIIALFFIANFFKQKRIEFFEIDEIGTQNLN